MNNDNTKPKKKKLEIKERVAGKATENFMANVTPLRSPIAEIFDFPAALDDISTSHAVPKEVAETQILPHTQPTSVTVPSQGIKKPNASVAPLSNFQKVTNTITRDAIPRGLFRAGKSKQVYDVLYGLTRGAIIPSRITCISKSKLRALSGVGDRTTMDACLNHLSFVGLIKQRINDGGYHEGNEYEVFTPEEIETTSTLVTTPSQGRQANPAQHGNRPYDALKSDMVGSLETRHGRQGSEPTDSGLAESPKTSLKTNTKSDDEADALFSGFIEKFQTAAKKLTGAPLSKYEREKWERLADLLILELETASRRTSNPVSSVPAFLTKILSSKLLNQKQPERISKSKSGTKPDRVGKYYQELDGSEDEVKSLNIESKEVAIDFLREFKDEKEFLESYKKWYTEDDWNWITKELRISD